MLKQQTPLTTGQAHASSTAGCPRSPSPSHSHATHAIQPISNSPYSGKLLPAHPHLTNYYQYCLRDCTHTSTIVNHQRHRGVHRGSSLFRYTFDQISLRFQQMASVLSIGERRLGMETATAADGSNRGRDRERGHSAQRTASSPGKAPATHGISVIATCRSRSCHPVITEPPLSTAATTPYSSSWCARSASR